MSQTTLAKLAGVSKPNISAYEAGRRVPRPETVEKIVRALRLRPSEIPFEHRDEAVELARKYKVPPSSI